MAEGVRARPPAQQPAGRRGGGAAGRRGGGAAAHAGRAVTRSSRQLKRRGPTALQRAGSLLLPGGKVGKEQRRQATPRRGAASRPPLTRPRVFFFTRAARCPCN